VREVDEILAVARRLVERVPLQARRIRLVGLGGSNMIGPEGRERGTEPDASSQLPLFGDDDRP
jgi:hypothetical protein